MGNFGGNNLCFLACWCKSLLVMESTEKEIVSEDASLIGKSKEKEMVSEDISVPIYSCD